MDVMRHTRIRSPLRHAWVLPFRPDAPQIRQRGNLSSRSSSHIDMQRSPAALCLLIAMTLLLPFKLVAKATLVVAAIIFILQPFELARLYAIGLHHHPRTAPTTLHDPDHPDGSFASQSR